MLRSPNQVGLWKFWGGMLLNLQVLQCVFRLKPVVISATVTHLPKRGLLQAFSIQGFGP